MRLLRFLLLVLLPLASTTHLSAQSTWVVDCSGRPWSHFTDLPQAVAAAASGDTIYVYADAGCWGYTAPIIDKPLQIVGITPFGAVGNPSKAPIAGRLVVRNVPAGAEVVLSHLGIGPHTVLLPAPPWVQPHGIEVRNCAGEVYLHHVSYNGGSEVNGVALFEDCGGVNMDWCDFYFAPTAVTFRRSNVQLNATVIQPGQSGGPWPQYFITQTTEGIRAEDSDVTLVGSVVWGAFYESSQNPERVAVHVQNGTLRVGPTTTLRGGLIQGVPVSGSAILALGTAQVVIDPRAVHTGNAIGSNPLTTGYLHAIDHTQVTRNEPFRVRVFGPPGGFMLLAVGNHAPAGVSTPLGTLELDPNALALIGAGALSAQGGHLEQTHWAWRGLPLGHVFAFQAAVIDRAGTISLTLPAPFTVGWEAGRTYP